MNRRRWLAAWRIAVLALLLVIAWSTWRVASCTDGRGSIFTR